LLPVISAAVGLEAGEALLAGLAPAMDPAPTATLLTPAARGELTTLGLDGSVSKTAFRPGLGVSAAALDRPREPTTATAARRESMFMAS
jgi:hypothetical protein